MRFLYKYDLIWTNWCLCFLDDKDLKKFMWEARQSLRKIKKHGKWCSGLFFIKENTALETWSKDARRDQQQSQRLRTVGEYEKIFKESGYLVLQRRTQEVQSSEKLCDLTMWVL